MSSTSTVTKKRISAEDKEKEIADKLKKKEQWYGYPRIYWLGGGLIVTLIICAYLASKLYGRNNNQQDNNQQPTQQSQVEPGQNPNYPPIPPGVTPYNPTERRQVKAISSHMEDMNKRDLINSVPVYSSHLAQFESRFSQNPKRQEVPVQVQVQTPNQAPTQQTPSNNIPTNDRENTIPPPLQANTDANRHQYPNNKEGGGEGVPLPPADYNQIEMEDAF